MLNSYHAQWQPKWRNWQTRQVQDLVPVKGVEVRVLSSAILKGQGFRSTDLPLAFFACVQFFCYSSAVISVTWHSNRGAYGFSSAKGDSYYCQFYFQGHRFTVTIGEVAKDEADDFVGSVGQVLRRIKQRLIHVPPGTKITDFVVSGGKVPTIEAAAAPLEPTSYATFRQKYLDTHRQGAMEANSLQTIEMHLRHFERTLGSKFPLQQLTLADLQRHVTERGKKKYRGRQLSPATLRKEVASFRAAWNWACLNGMVVGTFPSKGLVYPKSDEKPPFMTRAEIERRLTPAMKEAERAEFGIACT